MSVAAFLAWTDGQPDEPRHELEAGRAVAMVPELLAHVRAKYRVRTLLDDAIRRAGLPCEAIGDGVGVAPDDETLYQPDALVACGEPLDGEARVVEAPVVVVEVTSSSSSRLDAGGKLGAYARMPSVAQYLIVNIQRRLLVHHRREGDGSFQARVVSAGTLRLDPPGLDLDVSALFA